MASEAKPAQSDVPTIALVLGGGGARGAYQVGGLKGIADFVESDFPFRVVTGVSFENSYIQQLIDLGYQDAKARAGEIQQFLAGG